MNKIRSLMDIFHWKTTSTSSPPLSRKQDEFSSAQSVSSAPTLKLYAKVASMQTNIFSREYQMTIRTRMTTLTRKQATILSTVLVVKSFSDGVDLTGYLLIEWLLSFLAGSRTLDEISNQHEKRAVLMLNLILSWIRGEWMNMSEHEYLPEEVVKGVPAEWLPNARTWESWKQVYEVGKFFEARIVPLDLLIEERTSGSERYSGYTKGYGNGGHRSSTEKTPYDYELDGESTDRPPVGIPLQDMEVYNRLLLAIERAKILKRDIKK